jgi:hypothetical protein
MTASSFERLNGECIGAIIALFKVNIFLCICLGAARKGSGLGSFDWNSPLDGAAPITLILNWQARN